MKKIGFSILLCLFIQCNKLMAQSKIVEIEANFDFDVRFIPNRTESVTFKVKYSTHPKDQKSNYEIEYKPKGDVKFKGLGAFSFKSPIDTEEMKVKINEGFQFDDDAENDTVYIVSNNSIYDLAYILDTIPHPSISKTKSGSLILNNYIEVFDEKEEGSEKHSLRRENIQLCVQPITTLSLVIDKLAANKVQSMKEISDLIKTKDRLDSVVYRTSIEGNSLKSQVEFEEKKLKNIVASAELSNMRNREVLADISNKIKARNETSATLDVVKLFITQVDGITEDTKIDKSSAEIISEYVKKISGVNPNPEILKKIDGDSTFSIGEKSQVKTELSKLEKSLLDSIGKLDLAINDLKTKKISHESDLPIITNQKRVVSDKITDLKSKMRDLESVINKDKPNEISSRIDYLKNDILKVDKKIDSLSKILKLKTNDLTAKSIFQINKLSIQIERGFIERIQVYIPSSNNEQYNIFENIFAIGFSSIKNFKKFTNTRLYSRLTGEYVYLSDVISNFDNLLENYTRDYSPADTTINHFRPKEGFIRLNRDQFMNLFDARVYTDLMGINDSKPNGLVQIEVARKFNIQTSRRQFTGFRSDWGAVTYLNVFGSLNKIENSKKYLPLRNENLGSGGQLISPYYATNLDFRLYQNLSLGAEMNLFLFDWPDGKLTAYFDVGLGYGQTPLVYNKRNVVGSAVSKSERDSSLIAHSSTAYPKLTLEVFSEKRIRVNMSYQFNSTRIYSNNNFKAIASYAKSDLTDRATEPYARKSHMIEFNLMASPTSTQHGRFFFRARYFLQHRDHNTFFSQIQFGYTYSLRLKKFEL